MDFIRHKNSYKIYQIKAEVLGFNLIYNMLVFIHVIDCIHVVKRKIRKMCVVKTDPSQCKNFIKN